MMRVVQKKYETVPWILSIEYCTTRYRVVSGGVTTCINSRSAFLILVIFRKVGDKHNHMFMFKHNHIFTFKFKQYRII